MSPVVSHAMFTGYRRGEMPLQDCRGLGLLNINSTGSIGLAILAVALLLLTAHSIGSLVIRVGRWHIAAFDRTLIATATGLMLIAWFAVVGDRLTLWRYLNQVWLLATPALFGVCSFAWTVATSRGRFDKQRFVVRSLFHWQFIPFWLLAVLTLGPSLCSPAGWDELVYHSVLPQRWLSDGQLSVYDDLPYSGFPSLGEVLCWTMAPIEPWIAPRLFNWCCCVLSVLVIWRLLVARSRSVASNANELPILAAVAACPALLLIAQNCYVESLVLLNLAAVMLVSETMSASLDCRQVVLMSLLAAGAASVKLTGLIVPVLVMPLIVTQSRARLRIAVIAVTVIVLITGPFYLRTWLQTGNPCHPYLANWFVSDGDVIASSEFHHVIGSASFGMRSASGFVFGPVLIAFMEDLYDGSFGWQFIGLLALAVVAMWRWWRERTPVADASGSSEGDVCGARTWQLAVMAAVMFAFWFFTAQQARFLVPILVPIAMLAVDGLTSWNPGSFSLNANGVSARRQTIAHHRSGQTGHAARTPLVLRLNVAALLIASIVSLPWRAAGYYLGAWESLAGSWSREEILNDATGGYYVPLLHAIDEKTPPDARLAMLFEHRGLYVPRWHVIGTPYFQANFIHPQHGESGGSTVDSWKHFLLASDISHVVIANAPIGPDQAPEYADEWKQIYDGVHEVVRAGLLKPIWASDEHTIFEVVK